MRIDARKTMLVDAEKTMVICAGETMVIHADGSCRGNPGPIAIGVSIQDGLGTEVETVSTLIGHGTNNIAEYRAAIEGLKKAQTLGAKKVELRMDSELVVRQIEGTYQVRKDTPKPLHAEVMTLLRSFKKYSVKHVPREDNARADELANLAYEPGEEPNVYPPGGWI